MYSLYNKETKLYFTDVDANWISKNAATLEKYGKTETRYKIGSFIKPTYHVDTNSWVEGATQQDLIQKAVTDGKNAIKQAYEKHREAGKAFSVEYQDSIVIDLLIFKKVTEPQAIEVGEMIKNILQTIELGQWVSARYELTLIKPDPEKQHLKDYHSALLAKITDYIANNYDN